MINIARKVIYLCATAVLAVVTLAVALNLHELGHTVVARLAGDSKAVYYWYHREVNAGLCIGCNVYDEQHLSYMGNIAVTVAGVVTTQIVVICCLLFLPQLKRTLPRRILLLVTMLFAVDAPLQVFQAATANIATQHSLTRIDLADTLYLVMTRLPVSPFELKTFLAACLALYGFFLIRLFHVVTKRSRATA